jgi:hypothetical protein
MLTRAGITGAEEVMRVPRIDREEVRLLWHSDYWDGPLSGMLAYRGEECWFEAVAENDPAGRWCRRFVLLRLSAGQRADEVRWHGLFREHVGHHTDYDDRGGRPVGSVHPPEKWPGFYDAYRRRTPPDYSANAVLGWFEW